MMIRKHLLAGTAALFLFGSLASAQSAPEITLDQLVAKNAAAKGGADKLQAIHTRRVEGNVALPNGLKFGFMQVNKRPNQVREEYTVQGMVIIQAYDGKSGWQIDPTQGKRTAEGLGEEDTRGLEEDAEFDGALLGYKERGATAELLGKEDVDGSPAYKIKITEKNGDEKIVYLDEDYFLEIKMDITRIIRGGERQYEMSIGDYKEEGGVMMAHSLEFKPKNAPQGQKISYEKVVINPEVPDSYFAMPTAAPAPPAAAAPAPPKKK